MIKRQIRPSPTRSYFLFGPRQTGKSSLVTKGLSEADLYINLLPQRTYLAYAKDPSQFRDEVLAHHRRHGQFTCVVDEVQKLPGLLDEVHDLIENRQIRFVLTGSSARKLKRGAANLLAGRANTYHLYPLTVQELGDDFSLERALRVGLLPYLWGESRSHDDQVEFLRAYADTYLREEISAEGVVRNIGPFTQFLDIAAANDGQVVNFSNIARECGVSVKTAQEYYRILEDTFIVYRISPWARSIRKRLVAHSRYYFFDMGVANSLGNLFDKLDPVVRGRRFEQFITTQIIALNSYHRWDLQLHFWRTNTGSEVDLILARGDKILAAIEIKSSSRLSPDDTSGLRSFHEENSSVPLYVVSTAERTRDAPNDIRVFPWQTFLLRELPDIAAR